MGGRPFALVEDLDRLFGCPDGHFLAGQVWDTVKVLVERDVVVDVGWAFPDRKLVGVSAAVKGPVDPASNGAAETGRDASSPAGWLDQQFGNRLVGRSD
jgi:hypothetical protein